MGVSDVVATAAAAAAGVGIFFSVFPIDAFLFLRCSFFFRLHFWLLRADGGHRRPFLCRRPVPAYRLVCHIFLLGHLQGGSMRRIEVTRG